MKDEISLREAQSMVHNWIMKYGVRYFSELTNMAILAEETGEVARIISRRYGDQSFKNEEEANADLGDELADLLWVLICIANQTGVDLTKAFQQNLEKKTLRDQNRHLDNDKLFT
jgi:NTP pyrophosphatase (non-canonical NTP hydrolase)